MNHLSKDEFELLHLFLAMETHKVPGDWSFLAAHKGPAVTAADCETIDEIRFLDHAVSDPEYLPDRRSAEIVVLLAVGET